MSSHCLDILTFRVTWRHRSRGHSIPHRPFPIYFFRLFSERRTV